jgi:hypothetical protein
VKGYEWIYRRCFNLEPSTIIDEPRQNPAAVSVG